MHVCMYVCGLSSNCFNKNIQRSSSKGCTYDRRIVRSLQLRVRMFKDDILETLLYGLRDVVSRRQPLLLLLYIASCALHTQHHRRLFLLRCVVSQRRPLHAIRSCPNTPPLPAELLVYYYYCLLYASAFSGRRIPTVCCPCRYLYEDAPYQDCINSIGVEAWRQTSIL